VVDELGLTRPVPLAAPPASRRRGGWAMVVDPHGRSVPASGAAARPPTG